MKKSRRALLRWSLPFVALLCGVAAALWTRVPANKAMVKARWHMLRCPALPEAGTEWTMDPQGHAIYTDPAVFGTTRTASSPNLHLTFDQGEGTNIWITSNAFHGSGALLVPSGDPSPAFIRIRHDVADSLISVSAGFWMKCADPSADVGIVIRIDRADGSLREWNQKYLLSAEHDVNNWERFNFEWLLRDQIVEADDRIGIFIRNESGEDLFVDDLDIVFRRASPWQHGAPDA